MVVKHILTENSAYEINEEEMTLVRRPILGEAMFGDNTPIKLLEYEVALGSPMRALCVEEGRTFLRTTTKVLSIMKVEESV